VVTKTSHGEMRIVLVAAIGFLIILSWGSSPLFVLILILLML
jgi:hypothetical protein